MLLGFFSQPVFGLPVVRKPKKRLWSHGTTLESYTPEGLVCELCAVELALVLCSTLFHELVGPASTGILSLSSLLIASDASRYLTLDEFRMTSGRLPDDFRTTSKRLSDDFWSTEDP